MGLAKEASVALGLDTAIRGEVRTHARIYTHAHLTGMQVAKKSHSRTQVLMADDDVEVVSDDPQFAKVHTHTHTYTHAHAQTVFTHVTQAHTHSHIKKFTRKRVVLGAPTHSHACATHTCTCEHAVFHNPHLCTHTHTHAQHIRVRVNRYTFTRMHNTYMYV